MSFNSRLVKQNISTVVPLLSVATGTTTGGPTLALGKVEIQANSLAANVLTAVTTSSLDVSTKWQCSQDGSTWRDIFGLNAAANVQVAATGTGLLVNTNYVQACPVTPAYPYMRLAILSSGATGASGDNVTISYNFKKAE